MNSLSSHLLDPERTAAPGAVRAAAAPERDLPTAGRINWLRAGVLGANDGIVSIAATVVGVAGAASDVTAIVVAGVASLVAGALSMAAGEYVSVSSQRDAEQVLRAHGRLAPDAELVNPWHAALASLLAFISGGLVPLLVVLAPWGGGRVVATFAAVVIALVVTGTVSARLGGSPVARAVVRNVVGGSLAMAVTYGVGTLVGLAV